MRFQKAIGIIALSATVAWGCNDDVSGPSESRPPDSGSADVLRGALEVSVTVTGTRPDPDGHAVVVSLEGESDPARRTVESTGGTVRFADLPAGTHTVRLESLAANCSVEGDNPRPFTVTAGETTRVDIRVSCPGQGLAGVFERVSPHSEATEAYHGSLSERYVIEEDGTFRLQFNSANYGFFEYLGTYSLVDREIVFDFEASSQAGAWQATGTLNGDCLTVAYNVVMALSDFEDGEYCQPPGAPDFSAGAGIYVANADGSDATFLTGGNRPDWSPDGQKIAFDVGGQIYIINADGSNETSLNRGVDPAWSPDGTRIVFADEDCPSPTCSPRDHGISVMDADGSGVTQLVRGDFVGSPSSIGVGMPAWSPDGETIAFNYLGDGDIYPAHIYVMEADGSELRRLGTAVDGRQYAESDPDWSPDGSRIAFWSYGYGIATVSATGGAPSTVYHDFPFVHYGAKPAWSPDGNTIAFTADRNGNGTGPFIYLVDSGGGQIRLLIAGGYDPTWSPDGTRIAFVHGTPDA